MFKTYHWIACLTLAYLFVGCGSEDMRGNHRENLPTAEEEYTEDSKIESTAQMISDVKMPELDSKVWNNKAKQQLESIQDLVFILKDSLLDLDFRLELEKELAILYSNTDSSMFDINENELDFRSFKKLKIENEDTMSLYFKNKKQNLKAEFIVVKETKIFGETSEVVTQLELVAIRVAK